jgi:uncharacterized FlgJ-related protein
MRFVTLTCGLLLAGVLLANQDKKSSTQDYIDQWKATAIAEQNLSMIPASITLAQGIIESGNGNSRLAMEGNNHFGIKCHDWTGEKIYQDDDQKNDCFRKYNDATESFKDHSQFLKKNRYSDLFKLAISDYIGWAHGLKSAGYATHPEYAQKLINMIEKFKLYEYDGHASTPKMEPTIATSSKSKSINIEVSVASNTHELLENKQRVQYIVAKKGDTYCKIAKEFDLTLNQLYKYNDFAEKKEFLVEGDLVYLSPKRNKAKRGTKEMVTSKPMTITEVSQKEGIKVEKLMELNGIETSEETLPKGKTILLR